MTTNTETAITVESLIHAPIEKVWSYWTDPKHIVHWNNASEDWFTPKADNDLRVGGRFNYRMEARDGTFGFDFNGTYNSVDPYRLIEYTIEDGRNVRVLFVPNGSETKIVEIFEPETENSIELQHDGWQAILDNFKKYVESARPYDVLHFEIKMRATPEDVYSIMLDKDHYKEWTADFNPTSYFEGSWEKGSKMLFVGTDENGNQGGMVSRIKENIPNRFVSIEHLGILKNGEEIYTGPEVEGWAGVQENYTFKPLGVGTLLSVDMDTNHQFDSFFNETWPKALNRLKCMCENKL